MFFFFLCGTGLDSPLRVGSAEWAFASAEARVVCWDLRVGKERSALLVVTRGEQNLFLLALLLLVVRHLLLLAWHLLLLAWHLFLLLGKKEVGFKGRKNPPCAVRIARPRVNQCRRK